MARHQASQRGRSLGRIVIEMGFVTEAGLVSILAEQLGLEPPTADDSTVVEPSDSDPTELTRPPAKVVLAPELMNRRLDGITDETQQPLVVVGICGVAHRDRPSRYGRTSATVTTEVELSGKAATMGQGDRWWAISSSAWPTANAS